MAAIKPTGKAGGAGRAGLDPAVADRASKAMNADVASIKAHGSHLAEHGTDHAGHGQLGAKAFANGSDIKFGPKAGAGEVVGHEAAHVVQQRAGRAR